MECDDEEGDDNRGVQQVQGDVEQLYTIQSSIALSREKMLNEK